LIHFYKRYFLEMEASASTIFSIFYSIFCTGFIYQAKEFASSGFSPESILSINDWIGSEEIRFFKYHIKRTCGTLVLHSLLPLGYFVGYSYFISIVDRKYSSMMAFWTLSPTFYVLLIISVLVPLAVISLAWYWSLANWERHPFLYQLKKLAPGGNIKDMRADIETEFRRVDKLCVQTNPLTKVVVTDNWIVVIGAWPWSLKVSHKSDISLELNSCDNHDISTEGEIGGTQFLNLKVVNRRPDVEDFFFRLNSLEYQNLQDKLSSVIENVKNIQVYKTVSERFVEVFKEYVGQNPAAVVDQEQELEPCIGCMVQQANVKLQRVCLSTNEEEAQAQPPEPNQQEPCVNCYCRPMWCVDCMAKWFASRQDQSRPETWLSSKCPCPTCRSRFCILDIAPIAPS